MAIDPVCGMQVDEKSAAATYEYKGKTYYFCAPGCKAAFSRDPEKYLSKEEGPMMRNGEEGVVNFASTGGWWLAASWSARRIHRSPAFGSCTSGSRTMGCCLRPQVGEAAAAYKI